MTLLSFPVFSLMAIAFAAIGFIFGKLSERRDWNKIIEKGINPAPKTKK